MVRTPEPSPSSSGEESTALCASVPSSSLTPCSTIPGSSPDDELKCILKFLVQFVPAPTPKTKDSVAKRVSDARVLTSAKCAAILEEQEERKRKEQEEKDQWKAARERKKKEREEAAKKKAEERVKKAKQVLARSKKRQKSTSESITTPKRRKNTPKSSSATRASSSLLNFSAGPSGCSSAARPKRKKSEPCINVNECCVCYRTFEDDRRECTGSEWVECICKRWLHEECVCDIELDAEGRELLCLFCAL